MFTGIIEKKGRVRSVEAHGSDLTMTIICGDLLTDSRIGDSIAINGTCLTVTRLDHESFDVHVVPETFTRTNLSDLQEGSSVNLERAMPAGGRFDGHIVQGHVDGVGTITTVTPEGEGARLTIEVPSSLAKYVVEKGSICLDGVSLTVAAVDDPRVEIALIPHTLEQTVFGDRQVGDRVNIEVDVLAKYVERLLGASDV